MFLIFRYSQHPSVEVQNPINQIPPHQINQEEILCFLYSLYIWLHDFN